MTIKEALDIRDDFFFDQVHTDEEVFAFTEALEFLIRETREPEYMMNLGGYYYEQRQFDLALKYYEMAAEQGDIDAYICLGYIWYYGRTGRKDYKKAFYYFCAGRDAGDLQAAYKVADMYKNGYFVEKNYARYCSIIEELYPKVKRARYLNDPLPEIFTRLARIRMEQKRFGEAQSLLIRAKDFLAQRIREHPFFGDLNIMKWLIQDMYSLPEKLRPTDIDLFDMYHYLEKPAKATFRHFDEVLEIRSVAEEGACAIQFGGRWFRDTDDFFAKAEYDGEPLTALYDDFTDWKVTAGSAGDNAADNVPGNADAADGVTAGSADGNAADNAPGNADAADNAPGNADAANNAPGGGEV